MGAPIWYVPPKSVQIFLGIIEKSRNCQNFVKWSWIPNSKAFILPFSTKSFSVNDNVELVVGLVAFGAVVAWLWLLTPALGWWWCLVEDWAWLRLGLLLPKGELDLEFVDDFLFPLWKLILLLQLVKCVVMIKLQLDNVAVEPEPFKKWMPKNGSHWTTKGTKRITCSQAACCTTTTGLPRPWWKSVRGATPTLSLSPFLFLLT